MRYIQFFILLGLLLQSFNAFAEKAYVGIEAIRTETKAAGAKFKPYQAKVKAGYYLRQQIALEAQYIFSGDDDDSGSNLEIEQIYGGYIRLESKLHNRVRLFLLAGYAESALNLTGQSSFNDKYDGFSWGIGAEDRFVRMPNTYFTLEYMQYYDHDDVSISGISLGMRYLF